MRDSHTDAHGRDVDTTRVVHPHDPEYERHYREAAHMHARGHKMPYARD